MPACYRHLPITFRAMRPTIRLSRPKRSSKVLSALWIVLPRVLWKLYSQGSCKRILLSCGIILADHHSSEMPTQSRLSLVQALLGHLPEQSSPVVIVVKPDQHRPAPIRTNGHRNPPSTPVYDPSVVFVLEIATIIATCDSDSVALMGSAVAEALQNVVRDVTNVHPLVLSRAIFYLLTLLHASQV